MVGGVVGLNVHHAVCCAKGFGVMGGWLVLWYITDDVGQSCHRCTGAGVVDALLNMLVYGELAFA